MYWNISKNIKLMFHTLYRPPNCEIDFNNYFNNFFKDIDISLYDFICILGDLNINFMPKMNWLSKESNVLKEVLLSYGLHQIISKPTYPSTESKSILDLFL